MTMKEEVLLLKDVTKIKARNKVLDHFFMEVLSGEIINLIGLEGSGKAEIYSILFGDESNYEGQIRFMGKYYEKGSALPVERLNGIFFIGNQELIIPNLSVAENLYIIEKINYFQFSVSKKKMVQQARKLFEEFGIDIAPEKKAMQLNRYECYVLRLMRAYVKRARLIVIDDILEDCSFDRIDQIIGILEHFKREGMSILWLNSYPDAITEISDQIITIRRGRNSMMFYKDEYDKQRLLACLAGQKSTGELEIGSGGTGGVIFKVEHVQNEYFDNLTFECRKGEILGIYDFQNKFSRELRRLLLGRRNYRGNLIVENTVFRADSEHKLVRNRIGVVDGNKYQSLIFPDLSVSENLEMAVYEKTAMFGCFLNKRVKKYLDKMGIEICENTMINQKMASVSRRDAMQINFYRWKLANPKILFCFQPFLRLDAISRRQLETLLLEFKRKGTCIVLSSADISHLRPLCDRIFVIDQNRITGQIKRGEFSEYFQ